MVSQTGIVQGAPGKQAEERLDGQASLVALTSALSAANALITLSTVGPLPYRRIAQAPP